MNGDDAGEGDRARPALVARDDAEGDLASAALVVRHERRSTSVSRS